ncbi:A/G-specific adenine glycosylase, putative [Plasmodium gallinaceum]|uniref:Adenine DNA glycosylase n=1 Tax=Plasmodium gallinaceum TaxID=5849 RepID=A0A1J1GUX0_PLAGA|nr:A/G-specific adenine glycosylase, putative [Plasmodium gallinaceum]CRG96345.1 A/G-specific adenine glycosylase, putative [Plasmodium gallinaceum]
MNKEYSKKSDKNKKENEEFILKEENENSYSDYHYNFLRKNSNQLKKNLLEWYYKYRRRLPWRNDSPPYTTSVQLNECKNENNILNYFVKNVKQECTMEKINVKEKTYNNKNDTKFLGTKKEQDDMVSQKLKKRKKENVCEDNENIYNLISNGDTFDMKKNEITSIINKTKNENVDNVLLDKNDLSLKGYKIYISEIMLQQTKVHTVLNFYLKWMKKWNNIFELSKSNLDDVLIVWKGLGYYNRAKNLLECCKTVVEKYNGIFPNDLKLLKELPGIGNYTSKAICIHLYNRKDICIDTNIIRIFSRITDTINYYNSTILSKHCEQVSHILCSDEFNYSDLSQALMDLGSSICNNSPQCNICPINKNCLIYLKKNKKTNNLFNLEHSNECELCIKERNVEIRNVPLVKKKKKTDKICLVLLIKKKKEGIKNKINDNKLNDIDNNFSDDHYLMIKNKDSNLFSMHYLFPFVLLDKYDKKILHLHLNSLLKNLNLSNDQKDSFLYVSNFKHKFSHLTYDTYIYLCSILEYKNMVMNEEEYIWIKLKDIKDFTHNTFCQHIIDYYKISMNEKKISFNRRFKD